MEQRPRESAKDDRYGLERQGNGLKGVEKNSGASASDIIEPTIDNCT